MNASFWRGKRVLVTGHTGFKGSWLSLWLNQLGAEVHGISLAPPTTPNMFEVARIRDLLASHHEVNICDAEKLQRSMQAIQPEIILHLAAQSLVRTSYQQPVLTYATNVMGVVNVLEAARASGVRGIVNVTTDKCYENREWAWGYRENEALGGHDPYSSSKACAELVTAAYRKSFLAEAGIAVASARAGNVIGGGDWALDRLVPDCLRNIDANANNTRTVMQVRAPQAIRPWQHVLEPLSGYLLIAEKLFENPKLAADAWNLGPHDQDAHTVEWIISYLANREPNLHWQKDTSSQPHEAHYLKLDSSKARNELAWHPRWNLETALGHTLDWHHAWRAGKDMQTYTRAQIELFAAAA